MALTDAQLQVLANDLATNPDVADDLAAGSLGGLQAYYNSPSSGVWVFKTSVPTDVAREALDWNEVLDGTNGLDERQRWAFDVLLHNGDFNPTNEQTRDGFVAIFPGQTFDTTRTALLTTSTRLATNLEKLYVVSATGPAGGDGSSQTSCAALTVEGDVSIQDIDLAIELIP